MTDKEEAIERLNNFKTIKVLYGNTFAMHLEQLKQLQSDIETVLNLIQTQQAEIEHQKEKRENQKKELSILNEKQKEFNKLRNTVNSYKGQFKRQQAEIENYKKQKIYDEQFKHELLEEIRCKGLTIDSLNKILDDRLICIQGGRGLYAKLKGLDKEHLIREYLSMYKMCKEEIEKKDDKLKDIKNHIKAELKMIDKLYNEVGWAGKEQYDGMKAAYKCVLNIYFENEVVEEDK